MSTNAANTKINKKAGKVQENTLRVNIFPPRIYRILLANIRLLPVIFWLLLPSTLVGLLVWLFFSRGVKTIKSIDLSRELPNQQTESTEFIRNSPAESNKWIKNCSPLQNVCSGVDFYFDPARQDKVRSYLRSLSNHLNRNFIFHGEPGTGKSYCALQIAKGISSSYTVIAGGTLQRVYVGSGASTWSKIIRGAQKQAKDARNPVVIIVEEIDSLINQKGSPSPSADNTLVNTFLESVDRIRRDNDNIIIIGTTNTVDFAEPAAIRDGRFNKICFEYPSRLEVTNFVSAVRNEIENKYRIEETDIPGLDNTIIINDSYWGNLDNEIERNLIRRRVGKHKYPVTYVQILSSVEKMIIEKISSQSSGVPKFNDETARETVEYLLTLVPPVSYYNTVPFNVNRLGQNQNPQPQMSSQNSHIPSPPIRSSHRASQGNSGNSHQSQNQYTVVSEESRDTLFDNNPISKSDIMLDKHGKREKDQKPQSSRRNSLPTGRSTPEDNKDGGADPLPLLQPQEQEKNKAEGEPEHGAEEGTS